jgi:hypothetical protein
VLETRRAGHGVLQHGRHRGGDRVAVAERHQERLNAPPECAAPSCRHAVMTPARGPHGRPQARRTLRQIPAVTLRTAGILAACVLSGGTARRSGTW